MLENYSQATEDWNWELYRSDYNKRPNSLLSRGIQSLRTDGIRITLDKVFGLIQRKVPWIRGLTGALPVHDLRTPFHALRGTTRSIGPGQLINRQYAGDRFVDYETVAYWAALEATAAGDELDFTLNPFDTDFETLQRTEPDGEVTLRLNQRHRILDPVTAAWVLHGGCDEITCSFSVRQRAGRDRSWLRSLGFKTSEIEALEEARLDLLTSVGGLFYAIFWPPAYEYFDEMERILGQKVSIVDSTDVMIDDIDGFVHAVYDAQTDDAPDWAIDWKAETMTNFPNVVRVVSVDLATPRMHDGISREMEMVKNDVRHSFMEHFSDEYYLSILHATDSFEDNTALDQVLSEYCDDW
ncbi:hypothetical protein [Halovivax gelatinilyticus]|uniref:hypothetical protein n=1 Tax=Halovivax gelatinilyticus TaxID=2961597 RepID=UPI0020CA8835|nr:hypothetical protein [Halovivax gelatinilyticus]